MDEIDLRPWNSMVRQYIRDTPQAECSDAAPRDGGNDDDSSELLKPLADL